MLTREFVFEKATKNTYRYLEVAAPNGNVETDQMCGTIYIQKAAFPTKPPRIRVTVEEVALGAA